MSEQLSPVKNGLPSHGEWVSEWKVKVRQKCAYLFVCNFESWLQWILHVGKTHKKEKQSDGLKEGRKDALEKERVRVCVCVSNRVS